MNYDEILNNIGYEEKYENPGAILWSPGSLTKDACETLCEGGGKQIIDVGSGVGKFCLQGAHYNPTCHFTGVELDIDRHNAAVRIQDILSVNNATFICGNFIDLDFTKYDGVFLFNPFNMGGHVVHNEGKALVYNYQFDNHWMDEDYSESFVKAPLTDVNKDSKEKRIKIDQFIHDMNVEIMKKLCSMRVGSRVVMSSMYLPILDTGLFKHIKHGFEKIK